MKKIATYFGIFSVLFVLFFSSSIVHAQTNSINFDSQLSGVFKVTRNSNERMFDVSITKAEYVQNKSLVLELEFTKIKEGISYPEITFINGLLILICQLENRSVN